MLGQAELAGSFGGLVVTGGTVVQILVVLSSSPRMDISFCRCGVGCYEVLYRAIVTRI